MQTLLKRREFVLSVGFALFSTVMLLGVALFSLIHIWGYWTTASANCVECLSGFSKAFFEPKHLIQVGLFVWSSFRLIQLFRHVIGEWRFSSVMAGLSVATKDGVHLTTSSRYAAWSAGVISKGIFVNAFFWSSLTKDEQKALYAHESEHLKKGDGWIFFALGYVQRIFADPLSRRLLDRFVTSMKLACELEADRAAINKTSSKVLGSLLLKALSFESKAPVSVPGLETVMHERIVALTQGESVSGSAQWKNLAPVFAIGLMLVALPVIAEPVVRCLIV